MSPATLPRQTFLQQIEHVLNAMYQSRLVPGLMVSVVLVVLMLGRPNVFAELTPVAAGTGLVADVEQAAAEAEQITVLNPQMRAALEFVAHKYHVSSEALEPVFIAVQKSARETRVDPLLIVSVISIESRFNPYAESVAGAQGLMQVMPRMHQDKIPESMGANALFDPETNISVGAQVLAESIRREGGLIVGLQQFAGASDDPELGYANKVIAEKQGIEAAIRRSHRS